MEGIATKVRDYIVKYGTEAGPEAADGVVAAVLDELVSAICELEKLSRRDPWGNPSRGKKVDGQLKVLKAARKKF